MLTGVVTGKRRAKGDAGPLQSVTFLHHFLFSFSLRHGFHLPSSGPRQ